MSKGVLGNDPFKRGAADRSADTEQKQDGKPTPAPEKPEKPALPDPRSEDVKKRVKGRKPGAPFLESPAKDPQKTRIATKQKTAKPPLRPPQNLKRENQDPKAAVAAEKKRAAASEPESTAPTARRPTRDGDEISAEKQRAEARDAEPTQATQQKLDEREVAPERARSQEESSVPNIDLAGLKSRAESLNPEATEAAVPKYQDEDEDAQPASFDLKSAERRPIHEAIRTMTVDSTATSGEQSSTRDQVFDVSARGEPSSLQKVATETLSKAVMAAAGIVKALRAGLGAAGAVDLDPYGKDPDLGQSLGPVADFLYERYWRVTTSGAELVPEGPCILVANHSGALPYDGPVLHAALKRARPELADSRWLVEDQIFYAPVLGTFLNRLGAVRANPENALRLLEEGRPLIVFPEGIHGLQKPFAERYQLKRFGRGGFVKIALQTGAPIVPVAIVGAEETSPLLARIPTSLFGLPYLPVTPLGPLPLPARWHIRFGAPLTADDLRAAGEEEAVRVQRGTELTREAIQGMLEAVLRERPSAYR